MTWAWSGKRDVAYKNRHAMLCCTCTRNHHQHHCGNNAMPEPVSGPEIASKELSVKILEGEAKLEEGCFEEAEFNLREALLLNNEEARALLGRIEYQRGNVEGALQLFDGIQLRGLVTRLQFFALERGRQQKKGRAPKSRSHSNFLHASSLMIEAIYLKAKSFQRLGRFSDAAQECRSVLDLMEEAMPTGVPSTWRDMKLAKIIAKASILYPQLLAQEGVIGEALPAYRQALLNTWSPDEEALATLQKEFAILLLYGGVDASLSTQLHLGSQREGGYIPRNNTEEAILLLLLLLRRNITFRGIFDGSVLDHLSFALSICGQSTMLAYQYKELLPGTLSRTECWYNLALCYCGAGDNDLALHLLRKALSPMERSTDVASLLLAAKICAGTEHLANEGSIYAKRALECSHDEYSFFKSCALHVLGVAVGAQVRVASTNLERGRLQHEALRTLQDAVSLEMDDPKLIFDLGLEYARQRHLSKALYCARRVLEMSSGSWIQGWRFLALLLTAKEKHYEAEVVLESALEQTSLCQQGPLLQTRAKLELAIGEPLRAIQTYRQLLLLVRAPHQSFNVEAGNWQSIDKKEGRVEEVEVWQDLASIYTKLSQWHDAETCLEKALALKTYSAKTWHAIGCLHEVQGQPDEAFASYKNALAIDTTYVDSKVKLGVLLSQSGGIHSLPVARSYLVEALQAEPTHEEAWYQMGMLHKIEGHTLEAIECFQVAVQLEQSSPVEPFTTITPGLTW